MAITLGCDEDRLLLERVGRRDQQAIASLYDRHAGVVYSIALRVLNDSVLAEELLSDIFLEVWRMPNRFLQGAGGLSASMALMAGNRALAMRLQPSSSELERAPLFGLADYDPRHTTMKLRVRPSMTSPGKGEPCSRKRSFLKQRNLE